MSKFAFLFPLFIVFFLTSCQVKKGASTGGLISGHLPATNSFVLATPAAKTYVSGEVLTLSVSFPFDIIKDNTGGEPRLRLTVGPTTRYATFTSQPDPKTLRFEYTFASENDSDGVTVNALELNGSTLKFDNNGTITDCIVSSLVAKTLSGTKVDSLAPSITAFNLTNLPGMYNEGENINFAVTFSEPVYVTGVPHFTMNLSGVPVYVDYAAGSGTNVLIFTYTVTSSDSDSNGIDSFTSPINLNAGTIKDSVNNDATLNFAAFTAAVITYSNGVHISGQYPYVVDAEMPANKTYVAAEDLDFVLTFDREVTVSGLPYLNVTIGSNTRQAQYISGSGTEQITFRYTSVPGDVDANGIDVATSIVQNAGNIVDKNAPGASYFTDTLNNSFTHAVTTGIILNAIQPQATAVARNIDSTIPTWGGPAVDNVWIPGQDLNITVSFNTNMYVNQTNGTPSIPLTIGATTRQAIYLSGGNGQTSLVFRYTIQDTDLDTDGTIALGNILLNGGVITDSENTNTLLTLPVAGLTTTRIDGVKPVISSVTAPANGTYSQVASLNPAAMNFTVNWSEPVNFSATTAGAAYLSMDVGGTNVNLEYASGTQTAASVHRPSSLAGRNDANGVSISSPLAGTATIKDQAGNTATVFTFSPPSTGSILVDTTAPTVTSVTPISANGTYKAGQNIDFSVTFSESVTTLVSGGYPRIPVTIGSTTRYLVAVSSTTATTHTFRYTVVANEVDTDGIVVGNAVQHNGTTAYARDGGRNNSTGTFTPPSTPSINVDAQAPTVSSVTPSANKAYVSGETLQISITFSENVTVTGSPYIAVDFLLGTDNFAYASGSGTSTLVFSRTLTGTHFDMNGLPSSVAAITLNGGTIQDVGTNNAPTAFTAQNLSQIYVTYPQVKLWTRSDFTNIAPPTAPAISNIGAITTAACGTGTCRTFTGDDSLYLSGALSGVETVFMAFRTPTTFTGNIDLFGPDITLRDQTSNFDMLTVVGTMIMNGTTLNINDTSHNTNLATNTTNVMQMDFQVSQNYSSETLIGTNFNGGIGEVIAIEGTLTTTQKDNIRNYLETKY